MKVNEIPRLVFNAVATSKTRIHEELEPNHLGGKRIIAPLRNLDGWVVLADHSDLHCTSCMIFPSRNAAVRECWATCGVQVGPHRVGWDDNEQGPREELRASFFTRNSVPPLERREEEWISMVEAAFNTLNARAELVELRVSEYATFE